MHTLIDEDVTVLFDEDGDPYGFECLGKEFIKTTCQDLKYSSNDSYVKDIDAYAMRYVAMSFMSSLDKYMGMPVMPFDEYDDLNAISGCSLYLNEFLGIYLTENVVMKSVEVLANDWVVFSIWNEAADHHLGYFICL